MVVGSLLVSIRLAEGASLKDKRHVVRSLVETMRRRFHVAVAEVDDLDLLRNATLGIAAVSNSASHVEKVLDACLLGLEERAEFEIYDLVRETFVVK